MRYSKSQLNRRKRRRKVDENTANRTVEVQTKLDFLKKASFPEQVKVAPIGRRKDKTEYLKRREAWFQMMREKRDENVHA